MEWNVRWRNLKRQIWRWRASDDSDRLVYGVSAYVENQWEILSWYSRVFRLDCDLWSVFRSKANDIHFLGEHMNDTEVNFERKSYVEFRFCRLNLRWLISKLKCTDDSCIVKLQTRISILDLSKMTANNILGSLTLRLVLQKSGLNF